MLVPVLVFLGLLVSVVSSLGAPLVPTIALADHVSLASAQWSLTISLLVGALATPAMGRLGDGPGRRPVILTAIGAMTVGGALAALPLPFGWLLLGRGLMGTGLGLTPLTMATARDSLPSARARSTVALLSITTVIGVGLGYPITGFVTTALGFRAAFWLGTGVTAAALLAAWRAIPPGPQLRKPFDALGALLLGGGLGGIVLSLSQGASWGWGSPLLVTVALLSVALLAGWVRQELRTAHPLIELSLLRNRTVLTADVTGLCGGVGMYLLISMAIRYVQTPRSTGYGFGASVLLAGMILLPFSLASVTASRVAAAIARRTSDDLVLPIGCGIMIVATGLFVLARGQLWDLFVVMAVAGLGVGCTFAALPGLVVRSVPAAETGSAMSFNQVLRYVGYSVGSALSATILQAETPAGRRFPVDAGYTVAGLVGCAVLTVTAVLTVALPARPARRGGPPAPVAPVPGEESVLVEESLADGIPYESTH